MKDATQRLDQVIGSLTIVGEEDTTLVVVGDPHQAILNLAEANDVTLLVQGLHRSRQFFVLLRRQNGAHRALRSVLFDQ